MTSFPNSTYQRSRSHGFTLIEIAVVLLIAALIVTAGVGMTTAVLENTRNRTTRQNMDAIKIAVQGFISRNGRLPCPAVEGLAPSSATYGIEDTRTADPGTSCTNTVNLPGATGIDAAKRGVVPWKTLGLTTDSASDGWGSQITYMVSVTSTTVTFDSLPGIRGSLYVHSTTPVAAGLPATGNQINACSTTANDNTCNLAAVAVLISHGRNATGAYQSSGTRSPLPTGASEVENTNDDRFIVSAEPSDTFDDVVMPIAPGELIAPLAAQGAIKSERALLFDLARQVVVQMLGEVAQDRSGSSPNISYNMPVLAGAPASYTFEANRFNTSCDSPFNTAGVVSGNYAWDVSGDALQIVDPWNRTFKFARATATINSAESCKTPVVVISRGPDGTLNTADDYVYYSPMAEWKDVLGKVGW